MEFPNVKVTKILYATDLSENARYAFAYASSLARLYKAGIIFLHILPESSEIMDAHILGYISAEKWDEIKNRHLSEAKKALIGKRKDYLAAQAVLTQFSEDTGTGKNEPAFITDDIIIEHGNPVDIILKKSKEKKCDLIVMGTHGNGTLAGSMIGSTARRVVRHSEIPVLVVRLPLKK